MHRIDGAGARERLRKCRPLAEGHAAPGGSVNTGTLLLRSFQPFQTELLDRLARSGHAIRPKHGAVLANVDPGGTRLTVLARRAGMGKPALGELVDDLEAIGVRGADPGPPGWAGHARGADDHGRAAIRAATEAIAAIEARYVAQLGERGYRQLRKALLVLVPHDAEQVQPRR